MGNGYLPQEPQTFINIKLTNAGRQLLSLGQLTFNTAVFSDREINYNVDPTGYFNITSDRILAPKDINPNEGGSNFDGTNPITVQSVGSLQSTMTANTGSIGIFTGNSPSYWGVDLTKTLGYSQITYSAYTPDGTQIITTTGGTYFPQPGNLLFIQWAPIQNSGVTYNNNFYEMSANPTVNLFYRVMSSTASTAQITLDRPVPNFGSTSIVGPNPQVNAYSYPFHPVDMYYGTASTVQTQVWNMNIVRTSSEIGSDSTVSGYTTYGSIEFNGTKSYLGFSSETRQIGVVHYTNNFTGNTYAESLAQGSVVVDIPWIMWHNTNVTNGQGVNYGVELTDAFGPTINDGASLTTYRPLRDGNTTTSNIVGRVYHNLQIIVITDPELLTALTFKSNRNYTLPPLILGTSPVPAYPLSTSNATGLLQTANTYYVTYRVNSNSTYSSGVTFGYPLSLHCGYIQQMPGVVDQYGNPQFLTAKFPTNTFPYMRNSVNMGASVSFSGTGWNANSIQILVNTVNNITYPNSNIDNIPTNTWTLVSNGVGNGILSASTGTLDPNVVNGTTFTISQNDVTSGTTYFINASSPYSAFTMNNNSSTTSGLTFGDEYFFFGNISANIVATTYKSIITVLAPNTSFNSSNNPSFNGLTNTTTYITEIGVLNQNGVLVALGKPTYPIPKSSNRYLAFQLEIDF